MKKTIRFVLVAAAGFYASLTQASVITEYSNNSAVAVCDECTVSSSINITKHGQVADLDVVIKLLQHSFNPDLTLWITHDNASAKLVDQIVSIGSNFENTHFDDEAALSIYSGIAYAPYPGSFRPDQALSIFDGVDAYGLWTLHITDNWAGDDGILKGWSLNVKVPEPSPLILIGLGLLALGLRRKIAI